jgi:hypothetical protein
LFGTGKLAEAKEAGQRAQACWRRRIVRYWAQWMGHQSDVWRQESQSAISMFDVERHNIETVVALARDACGSLFPNLLTSGRLLLRQRLDPGSRRSLIETALETVATPLQLDLTAEHPLHSPPPPAPSRLPSDEAKGAAAVEAPYQAHTASAPSADASDAYAAAGGAALLPPPPTRAASAQRILAFESDGLGEASIGDTYGRCDAASVGEAASSATVACLHIELGYACGELQERILQSAAYSRTLAPRPPHGTPWHPTAPHGTPWHPMPPHATPCHPMPPDGNRWQPMATDGNRWQPMATDGNRW